MNLRPARLDRLGRRLRRGWGWLLPLTLVAIVPKCPLCAFLYVSVGSTLGLGGWALCGAPPPNGCSWLIWLALLIAVVTASSILIQRWRAHSTRPGSKQDPTSEPTGLEDGIDNPQL